MNHKKLPPSDSTYALITTALIIMISYMWPSHVLAQQLVTSSLNPAGTVHQNVQGVLSWTLGQVEQTIFTTRDHEGSLHPGFQRGSLQIVSSTTYLEGWEDLEVYPNPTMEMLYLAYPEGQKKELEYRIWSPHGAIKQEGPLGSTGQRIDVSSYPPGMYILELLTENILIKKAKILKL